MANGLEKPSGFAVSAFFQDHPVPLIGTTALAVAPHALELCFNPVQLNSTQEPLLLGRLESAADAGDILALKTISGVHETIRKVARVGEEQKPGAVQVQTADRDPTSGRQAVEDRAAAARVTARDQLADRLVIKQDSRSGFFSEFDRTAVHRDGVGESGPLP